MASKIKVDTIENVAGSGNVSLGSGHNLVVPGNNTTSGNATVGGNLTVDTNTLVVDSSNNRVGIGTTSPDNLLHIKTTGSTPSIELEQDSGTSYKGLIKLAGNDLEIRGSNGNLEFYNGSQDGDSSPLVMKSDASGRITKPNQPMFSISGGPNSFRDGSSNETVILHGQSGSFPGDMNIGGHFSYSNGRFTAPVAGNYMFTYTLTSGDTNSHFIEIRVNDGSRTTVLLYATQYQSGCHSTIYTLAANDFVTAQRRGTGYNVYSAVFSGFLVG